MAKWHICTCEFRRTKGARTYDNWEPGIAFTSEQGLSQVLLIVDAGHMPVNLPYDYRLVPTAGAVTITRE